MFLVAWHHNCRLIVKQNPIFVGLFAQYCHSEECKFIFIWAVFNFLSIKKHLSVTLFFWTLVWIMNFFLTLEACNCGERMLGFLLFSFLFSLMWAKATPSLSFSMTFVMSFGALFQLFMSQHAEDSVDGNAFMPWVCWFSRSSITQHETHCFFFL